MFVLLCSEFWGDVAKDFFWKTKYTGKFLDYNFDVTKGKFTWSAWKVPQQTSAIMFWTAMSLRGNWGTKWLFIGQCLQSMCFKCFSLAWKVCMWHYILRVVLVLWISVRLLLTVILAIVIILDNIQYRVHVIPLNKHWFKMIAHHDSALSGLQSFSNQPSSLSTRLNHSRMQVETWIFGQKSTWFKSLPGYWSQYNITELLIH